MTPEDYRALLLEHGVPIELDPDLGAVELLDALEESDDESVSRSVSYGRLVSGKRLALLLPPDRSVIGAVRSAVAVLGPSRPLVVAEVLRALDAALSSMAVRPASDACAPPPKTGTRKSGYLWPHAGGESRAESKARQRQDWERGRIPTAAPEDYEPGKPVSASKPLAGAPAERQNMIPDRHGDPDLEWFASGGKIVVLFSGGKDSLACALRVLDLCRELEIDPAQKVELWHHAVDGRPPEHGGEAESIWDWPVTEDYCRKVAACLGLPIYFSWREGGIMGEVLKEDAPTAAMFMEMPDGSLLETGGIGDDQTRRSFPKQGAVEGGRWCSSVVKIDVGRSQLSNREDLYGQRVLVVSGERAEESSARSQIPRREFDSLWKDGKWSGRHGSRGRHVEKWRPIHRWCEIDVWGIIARWKITVHPAYRLGWGRLSCMTCIFGSPAQWATIREIDRRRFDLFAKTERKLLRERDTLLETASQAEAETIRKRRLPLMHKDEPLPEFIGEKRPYRSATAQPELVAIALERQWAESPISDPWRLPSGAFGEDAGPT